MFDNVISENKNIKILPVPIAANGNEHDRDIALAIRYAVDNGVKIINYSSGKSFSLHPKWVTEALQYADKNDVLVILSAGNDKVNIDNPDSRFYPEDFNANNEEIISNLIVVGTSSKNLNHFCLQDLVIMENEMSMYLLQEKILKH